MHIRISRSLSIAALVGVSYAAPYNPFPLKDGFPNPSPDQLVMIGKAAGGSLPNTPLPTYLSDMATVTLQLIVLNEEFEVAYFNSLLSNITDGAYDLSGYNKTYATETVKAIRNQEELHATGANAILKSAGKPTIDTCQYKFPVADYKSAIALAETFTEVVLSILPLAQVTFAKDGGDEIGLVQLLGSIIGNEAEQVGWFRSEQRKIASSAPFLTTSYPSFAFTILKNFIVEGSCPNIYLISDHIPSYKALNVVSGAAQGRDSTVTFSVPCANGVTASGNSVVFLSGQNKPITAAITNVKSSGDVTTFDAVLPASTGLISNGLTIASVVSESGKSYNTVTDFVGQVQYGPGLIEL